MSKLRIVVTGLIAQHPRLGGVAWDYVQYVVGLARLGHDVYYLEDSGEWPYKMDGGPTADDWVEHDCRSNIEHLAGVMTRFGLGDHWMYRFPIRPRWFGLASRKRTEVLRSADILLNVSGSLERPANYRRIPRLVYIDSDPVFTQAKLTLTRDYRGFQQRVGAHDVHFSFGERITAAVPATRYRWRPTRQPIVLSQWRPKTRRRNVFTTVMSWTSYKPLTYARGFLGQKDVEFTRFLSLPAQVRPARLEVAMGRTHHANWQHAEASLPPAAAKPMRDGKGPTPRDLLTRNGWRVVDSTRTCADLDGYRRYIESSKGEWSVAKNGYVVGQPAWFSCRSACYLAAGRPVIVQDTGFSRVLPVGEGVLPFRSVEEAVVAIRDVEANYPRHARAARAIAEEYFDSDKVLTRLLDEAFTASE